MYTVKPGAMAAWLDEWSRLVFPLRRSQGFEVVGAWVAEEEDRFVWILAYADDKSWDEAEAAFYASPARAALDLDPARHLAYAETWALRSVLAAG
jgi:hypothetical protein